MDSRICEDCGTEFEGGNPNVNCCFGCKIKTIKWGNIDTPIAGGYYDIGAGQRFESSTQAKSYADKNQGHIMSMKEYTQEAKKNRERNKANEKAEIAKEVKQLLNTASLVMDGQTLS